MQNQWIALFLHDRVNNYQLLLREDAETTALRYDHRVVIYSADKIAENQVKQIRSVISESKSHPPSAILVSPVRESSLIGAMVDAANQRIPWIYLCRWSDTVHTVRRDRPGYSAFSVAADQAQIGRLQGQMLRCLISDEQELVYIQGPQGTSSVSRRQMASQRELKILQKLRWAPYNSDWSTEGGAHAMRSWLANFKCGKLPQYAVCAQNDDMAWGARIALVEGGHVSRGDSPIIIGCDGLSTFGQRLVAEGMLTATVIVPPVSGRALDELFRAQSMRVTAPAEVSVEVVPYPGLENLEKGAEVYEKRHAISGRAPDPSTAASDLFAATLKEVAASSRQATAARALSTAAHDGPPQGKQTSEPTGATSAGASRSGATDGRSR